MATRRCPFSEASSRRGTKLYRIEFTQEALKRVPTVRETGRGNCTAESIATALLVIFLLVPSTTRAEIAPSIGAHRGQQQQLRRQAFYRGSGAVTVCHSWNVRSDPIVVAFRRRRRAPSLSRGWLPILPARLGDSLLEAVSTSPYEKSRPSRSPKLNFLDGCRANPPPPKDRYAALSLTQRRATAT